MRYFVNNDLLSMSTTKKCIVISSLIALMVPVIINFVVAGHRIWLYPVANGEWVDFWASYLGAIITASTSFIILWFSLKENRRKDNWKKNVEDYKNLKEDIAYRISLFDATEINQGMLAKRKLNVANELDRLQHLYHQYLQLYNYLFFMYGQSDNIKQKKFSNEYEKILREAIDCINNLTEFLYSINSLDTIYKEYIDKRNSIQHNVNIIQEQFRSRVVPAAIDCIEESRYKASEDSLINGK